MPSAKFTESEVLEPSESFCEREKISEVEADLRAYFAWEKGKPLPGWIYDKLKKYPLLTEHTIKFLHWLSSQPATNKCKAKTCSLYDIMVDCMITDIIMSVLSEYEKQYRIKECRHPRIRPAVHPPLLSQTHPISPCCSLNCRGTA